MALRRIVVVGGSLGGLRAAEALRSHGFDGELTVVGAERWAPYSRPPLSKELLSGRFDEPQCALRREVECDWRLGVRATGLELTSRRVHLDDGDEIPFDGLIIATGARARAWPGRRPELDGIFTLRELDDARLLRSAIEMRPRVIILGAGFIGSEVAATLRRRQLEVALVDPLPHPLRPLGRELGTLCAEVHAEHGVHLHMNARVDGFEGHERVEAVRLTDGTRIEGDLVLAATGAQPNVEWLQGSGLRLEPGVMCDATLAALGTTHVYAVGDVAQWPHPLADGAFVRVEHWSNAAEQGRTAAANLLAPAERRKRFESVPSFWTDQYELKIQSVGFPDRADEIVIVEGSKEKRHLVAACARNGRLVGAIAFSWAGRIPWYRRQVAERRLLADLRDELADVRRF